MAANITPNQLIELIIPTITLVFSLSFACAWVYDKRLRYLLFLAASFSAFALGSIAQVAHLPDEWRLNALISASFYVLSTQLLAEGILRRAGLHFPVSMHSLTFALVMGCMYYFSYVASNLLVRIYILNLNAGLWMLFSAACLRKRCNGRIINYILFWVLLICGVSFFVRTPLTVIQPLPHSTAPFGQTIFWVLLQLSLALMGAVLGLVLLAAAMSDVIDRLILERDRDSLTDTLNRRAFERLAGHRIADMKSYPLALIAFDIDNFKSINDRYGHAAGDAVLREFGAILRAAVREKDVVGRLGGEEFVLLLPGTDGEFAYRIAERLRTVLESSRFDEIDAALCVTTSAGIAQYRPREAVAALLARADHLLYAAKRAGRNRVLTEASGQRSDASTLDVA
ncbi:GGDEF domain-containing protein (plasmid) [Paraburkholderia sprentiae WSM5005]|uniref:diguanylate cyclase n=2 Tax=Paraburkholderia sprentiae TaxID=948107 RepID=A0A1I9YU55_9BURK|nr:GGDEF domain-containing protein [Paraburkholderia sprentiae WSM5005]